MVFHSPVDTTVGIDHAMKIFEAAKQPKSFISLDRADHLLSDADDARYVGSMIAAWARRFIGRRKRKRKVASPGDNRVVVRTEKGYRTEILANGHPLLADEPLRVGGTNAGPTPYELLDVGPRRLHLDHPADVRRSQGVAARRRRGATLRTKRSTATIAPVPRDQGAGSTVSPAKSSSRAAWTRSSDRGCWRSPIAARSTARSRNRRKSPRRSSRLRGEGFGFRISNFGFRIFHHNVPPT